MLMFRRRVLERAKACPALRGRNITTNSGSGRGAAGSSLFPSEFRRQMPLRWVEAKLTGNCETPVNGQMNGWVQGMRTTKMNKFVDVIDGSRMGITQAVIPLKGAESTPRLQELARIIHVGSAVRLSGQWFPVQTSKGPPKPTTSSMFELKVQDGDLVAECDGRTMPIQNKYQTPQFLRNLPHLRARASLPGEVARFRSAMTNWFGTFFADRAFVQVHPPVITSSDCEGAGEVFTVRPESQAEDATGNDFFGSPKYLTVSSQLHLEAMAQSLNSVWSLSPAFRAEKSDTGRHLSEFYLLEAEMAFADGLDNVMNLVETCVGHVVRHAARIYGEMWVNRPWEDAKATGQLEGLGHAVTADTLGTKDEAIRRWTGIIQNEKLWPRITYTEAIQFLSKHERRFQYKPTWGSPLQTEHEKFLAVEVGGSDPTLGYLPVFVTHYPRDIKPFYMAESQSPLAELAPGPVVDCFDLIVPEMGELVGGSLREHRYQPLKDSMERSGIKLGPDMDWYLDLRRWGCAPHGGFGIGFDRLLSYLTTVPNIRDVATFPRWPGRCDC